MYKMFRLQTTRTHIKLGFQIYRNYLSNEYKTALSGFDILPQKVDDARSKESNIDGIVVTDIVNGIILDDNRSAAFQSFLKLRSMPEKATVFDATSYAIFRNFVDNENLDEVLPIIKNRLESGLFVDNFIGCYLLSHFLEQKNFLAASELGVEIYKQETLDNKLVVAFILKAFLEYLKQNIEQISAPVAKETKPTKKSDVVKVRVKFVRNIEVTNLNNEIGKALCRIAELYTNDVVQDFKLLGVLLNERYDLATSLLTDKNINYFKDTVLLSQALLKNRNQIDEKLTTALNWHLEKTTDSKEIDTFLSSLIENARKCEESKLISEQRKKYEVWKEQDAIERKKFVHVVPPSQRKETIEKIVADLTEKKQKLWYFENEEQIDLEIFKKNKFYPRRWFGKRKKPRAIDDNYVPPEISRKMA